MTDQQPTPAADIRTDGPTPEYPVAVPNECQSCGAPLRDVPNVADACPHCSHRFSNMLHFGFVHWRRLPRQQRDGDPETQASIDRTAHEG